MRSAAVYQIKNKIIFCSSARTSETVGISIPPYIHLLKDASDEHIASAIGEIIQANQFDIPHPKQNEWAAIGKMHLEGLGVKSMSEIHKKAIYCLIEENHHNLIFTPSEKEGNNGGFLHVTKTAITVSITSQPKQIAEALRQALQISMKLSTC